MLQSIEEAARSLAVAVRAAPVNDDAELEAMMAGLAREEHGGVLVLADPFTGGHRDAIVALAARHRLPAVYPFHFFIASGGLMSYGPDIEGIYRRSADYIDRILKGTAPSELPVQYPTKFELVINLKTAKALFCKRKGEETFAGTRGSVGVAPIPAVRRLTPRTGRVRPESPRPACALGG